MKHFNYHHLALIPLLTILAMSPSVMESTYSEGRTIASIQEEVKGHPKYESVVSKIKPEEVKDLEITPEKYKEKIGDLKVKLSKEKESFKKEQSEEALVNEQRKNIEKIVVELLLVEKSLKQLEEKSLLEKAEIDAGKQLIVESKDIVESLLTDLEANEVLVAKAKAPQDAPKIEDPKKEDKPLLAEGPVKEEPKKDEAPKKEICEAEEKNKVLTAQVEELMKQQNQILQAMIGMTNMMVTMFQQQQNQQPNPYYQNGPGFMTSPYQYQQPQTAGNWVYYPSGFQPSQSNIFAAPQGQQQQMQQPAQQQFGGIYPDQMHQQQSNWSLQPDPRFQTQAQPQQSYGTFGADPFSFNMNPVPTMAQR